jgi:RNA polymerase-binding transcription factor DksA
VDEGPEAQGAVPGDGICVECGVRIPREHMATLADAFRCGECVRSYEAAPGQGEQPLKKTA